MEIKCTMTIVEKKIGSTIYYIYTDGDGTEHYFYEDEEKAGTFVDEDNLDYLLKMALFIP